MRTVEGYLYGLGTGIVTVLVAYNPSYWAGAMLALNVFFDARVLHRAWKGRSP